MANKAPPYPKQKYTDAKFREILPQLPLPECLKIEYLSKGVWFKMISKRANSHNCECCGVENLGPTPIVDHVRGKKHRAALQNAERLFHPNYTTPKNSNAPARTPILDAINALAGPPGKGSKQIPTKVTTVQKTAGVGQAKAGAAQAAKQQPQKAAAKKTAAAVASTEQNKNAGTNEAAAAKAQTPKVTEKAVEPKDAEEKKTPDDAIQSKTDEALIKDEDKVPPKTQSEENTEGSEQSVEKDAKQDKEPQQNPNKNETIPEKLAEPKAEDEDDVIFISDNLEEIKKAPENPVPVGKAITVINSAAPKPQRPQKNAAKQTAVPPAAQQQNVIEQKQDKNPPAAPQEAKKIETITATTPKKVINPAAVLAKSAEKTEENTPRYEQNRVIIPTVDKLKKKPHPEASGPKKSPLQTFSTKTFTTNLNDEIEGIIGVEYVVKILKVYNDPEPFYECCLCEVVMDGIGMQTHLLGYNHRYKYVEKHFPTCFNQYKEHIGNIEVMGIILDRVAKAIESHHGRELPYECLSGEFRSNRHGVMTTVYSFRHASEYSGPSFTNVVDAKQVEEFYKTKNVYLPPRLDPKRKPTFDTRNSGPVPKRNKVDPISVRGGKRGGIRGNGGPSRRPYREEVEPTVDDEVHKQMVEEFLQNTCDRTRSPGGHRRRHKSRSRSRSRSPHRFRRPARRSPSPLREGDVWQAYRHLVDRSKGELDEMYKEYRKDPEKHPSYDEEWRKFWKQRKDEITREGLDYRNYDFQPEWVRFFAVRIEELYDEAVENIKISSRQRLILPMTNDELEDKRYHVKVPDMEPEIGRSKETQLSSHKDEKKMSVVHVLRLLTALEDYLGSLGPRVVDLLSKALLVEKSNPRDVNEIVLTLENCTILETAMEKLKGVLIAGLLEGPKIRAFNNVITETEKILKYAFKIRELNPQPVPQPVPAPKSVFENQPQKQTFPGGSFASSQQSNSVGNGSTGAAGNLLSQIDKKELATKLAAALTAQGKTDFNPEQLQQLIAVYSLIDKKKRDSAAADKQKMTLSDTLTALLNPKDSSTSVSGGGLSGTSNHSSGRNVGSYSSGSNDRTGGVSNSSINNFVSMLNRDNQSGGGAGKSGDSQMWQNLQNIQQSLRMQNPDSGAPNTGGYISGSSIGERREGRRNCMDNMSQGGSFNRGGFGAAAETGIGRSDFSLGQNSSMGFNRGNGGGRLGNINSNKEGSGFYGNLQGMSGNSSNFSRSGDSMPESRRGFGGSNSNFPGNIGYSRGGLTGEGNGNRGSLSTGGSGFGNSFNSGGNSSSGGYGSSSFQRGPGGTSFGMGLSGASSGGLNMSSGGSSGFGMGSGNSFNRGGGGGGGSSGYGSFLNSSDSFNKNTGRNDVAGNQQFNSRGMGGNQGNISMGRNSLGVGGSSGSNLQNPGGNRGGSNWRNQ